MQNVNFFDKYMYIIVFSAHYFNYTILLFGIIRIYFLHYNFLLKMLKQLGKTVVVTHDPTVASFADRTFHLQSGQMVK